MQVFNILSLINVETSVTCVTAEASGQLWEERESSIGGRKYMGLLPGICAWPKGNEIKL